MLEVKLPRDVIKSAERRWERTLRRQASIWKDRQPKTPEWRTAVAKDGGTVPVEVRRPASSFAHS